MAKPSLQIILRTANQEHDFLQKASIPHVIIGGIAVHLQGRKRKFRDVDLLMRRDDWPRIQRLFESAGYTWNEFREAYYSPEGVRVDRRFGGEDAGNMQVLLPDPAAIGVLDIIENLPVLALARLIEAKLACAFTPQRVRGRIKPPDTKHKTDVAELVRIRKLDASYNQNLHASVHAHFAGIIAARKPNG